MNHDWLIIGGGIHGVHVAVRLIAEGGVSPDNLRILDPAPKLLSQWHQRTATTGMTHLRSPVVHNLDVHPHALHRFAGKRARTNPSLFAAPYDRPALDLFNAHCHRVVESFGLEDLHVRAHADSCTVDGDGVTVRTSGGRELRAQNVVLALGSGERPEWPEWAPPDHPSVHHIFESGFDGWPESDRELVAVVGGGMSATQVALRLAASGHRVQLVCRHAVRTHQFDVDPGWLGPKRMAGYHRERDLDRRRATIDQARHRGSVSPDIGRALRHAISRGRVIRYEADIQSFDARNASLRLRLSTGAEIRADHVLLATGFTPKRPGGGLVDQLIRSAELPCARCGYPIVDSTLRWHPRIRVTGPLAELELGPSSRNIAGAREAGERLVRGIRSAG